MKLLYSYFRKVLTRDGGVPANRWTLVLILCFVFAMFGGAGAQTSGFTYQGKLIDSSVAANGTYDLQFKLYDAVANGNQIGSTITKTTVQVSEGVFTVTLDYGITDFDGSERFLEIAVRPQGSPNAYTVLGPRQSISSAPYAIRSKNAANADTAVSAGLADNSTQLGGINADQYVLTTDPRLAQTSGNFIQNSSVQQTSANFNISGNGSANSLNAATTYQLGGAPILSVHGNTNLFEGVDSGHSTNAGELNSFFGMGVGTANKGDANSFFGSGVGSANTTGGGNSFFGALAGAKNTTASLNSFFGAGAGRANTTGDDNSFFGNSAGQSNVNGYLNAFFGANSGLANKGGTANSFFGSGSGANNLVGDSNSFFGVNAGYANTDGDQNTLIGADAGQATSTGLANTFVGSAAGLLNTTGEMNTTLGYSADVGSGDLINATAIGSRSFVSQSNSLILGSNSSINSSLPDTNVGIGTNAPRSTLHVAANGGNILQGDAGCNSGYAGIGFGFSMTACANYSLAGNGNNTIINRSTGGSIIFRENNVTQMALTTGGQLSLNSLGSGGTTQLCRNPSNQISACSSSLRYKTNVNPFRSGLNMVKQFRPITFDWKDGGMHDLGLGAEDVAKVNELLVIRNEKGQVEGVKYDRIGVVLINAVKEQQTQIELQDTIIASLESHLARIEQKHHKPAARTRRTK